MERRIRFCKYCESLRRANSPTASASSVASNMGSFIPSEVEASRVIDEEWPTLRAGRLALHRAVRQHVALGQPLGARPRALHR